MILYLLLFHCFVSIISIVFFLLYKINTKNLYNNEFIKNNMIKSYNYINKLIYLLILTFIISSLLLSIKYANHDYTRINMYKLMNAFEKSHGIIFK